MAVTKATDLKVVNGGAAAVAAPTPFTETVKVALYGKYGSRKTLQIASLIDLVGQENVLVVSAESGLNTVRSRLIDSQVVVVRNLPDMRAAWQRADAFARQPSDGTKRWVVVDGMSEVTEWIANEQLSMADRYYEATKLGRDPATADLAAGKYMQRGEINSMAIYGRVGRDSSNLIAAWIKLPCNLYANYLEDMTGSSGFEKTIPWGPDVPGRVGLKAVMSSFDFVGRLTYNERNELVAGFDATSRVYMARTREDRTLVQLPSEITSFELGKFVQLLKGETADAG